jgi:hypothetical protein
MSGLLLVVIAVILGLSGCAKAVVPDVSQQDLDQAKQTLATAKLKPGNISGASGAGAYVVSQSPVAGQQVTANSTVDLVAQLPITLPALTGEDVADAVSALQGLGLKVAFLRQTGNLFTQTKVVQQDPTAGSSVHGNATVTLTVSTPPNILALLGLASKEAAYQNLSPEYKNALDAFLGNPNSPTSPAAASTPTAPSAPAASSPPSSPKNAAVPKTPSTPKKK